MRNPFELATPVAKKTKVLLYGPSGSGKTLAGLSWPRVAVIDTEGGTDLYAGRAGIAPFHILRAKTIAQVKDALTFIQEDKGRTFDTLMLDPVTVIYDVTKEAAARTSRNGELGFREWGQINNKMKWLYNELTNLPIHVVATARQAIEYETVNGELRKSGQKPDADKALVYIFDFVLRLLPDHSAIVEKSRGVEMGEGGQLAKVDWSVFAPIAAGFAEGEGAQQESDDRAVERELAEAQWDAAAARAWADTVVKTQGLTVADILAALKVERLGDWPKGASAADERLKTWLDEQLSARPAQPALHAI